jgi:hypothetical protein
MSPSVPFAACRAAVAALGLVSCRPSASLSRPETRPEDGAITNAAGSPADPATPDPCGSAAAGARELRVEIDEPIGFAPPSVRVSGADVPLFVLIASGQGRDTARCTASLVDAGAGTTEVHAECEDGPLHDTAAVRLSGTRLDFDVVDRGRPRHGARAVKPCARLAIGRVAVPLPIEPSPGKICEDGGAVRKMDAFLRRGKKEAGADRMPLFLDVPALGLHVTVARPKADAPDAEFEACSSNTIAGRGWAYVQCGAAEEASYARVLLRPGEVIVDRGGLGAWPRERFPIPCGVELVLHDLPCGRDCASPP